MKIMERKAYTEFGETGRHRLKYVYIFTSPAGEVRSMAISVSPTR